MSCVIKMKGTRHLSDKKSNLVSLYQQLHTNILDSSYRLLELYIQWKPNYFSCFKLLPNEIRWQWQQNRLFSSMHLKTKTKQ